MKASSKCSTMQDTRHRCSPSSQISSRTLWSGSDPICRLQGMACHPPSSNGSVATCRNRGFLRDGLSSRGEPSSTRATRWAASATQPRSAASIGLQGQRVRTKTSCGGGHLRQTRDLVGQLTARANVRVFGPYGITVESSRGPLAFGRGDGPGRDGTGARSRARNPRRQVRKSGVPQKVGVAWL